MILDLFHQTLKGIGLLLQVVLFQIKEILILLRPSLLDIIIIIIIMVVNQQEDLILQIICKIFIISKSNNLEIPNAITQVVEIYTAEFQKIKDVIMELKKEVSLQGKTIFMEL